MIDWLRGEGQMPIAEPEIELCGEDLPIIVRRHPRAKRLTLRLAPDGSEVRVSLPRWASTREAIQFAHARAEWLAAQKEKLPPRSSPKPGGTIQFRGETLAIDWRADAPRKPQFAAGCVQLGGPQSSLTRRLQKALEGRALELFEADRDDYCKAAGLKPAPVRISRAQRRWGSCSDKDALRINWRLVQAPDAVRRSVVAHEVTHLVHFDHSPAFHALLDELYEGDISAADRWLKEKGRTLYTSFG